MVVTVAFFFVSLSLSCNCPISFLVHHLQISNQIKTDSLSPWAPAPTEDPLLLTLECLLVLLVLLVLVPSLLALRLAAPVCSPAAHTPQPQALLLRLLEGGW